jgi:integrase
MKSNSLSKGKVDALTERGFYCDGGGLYVQVSKSGTKSWVFRFMINGRSRDMGLGSIDTFTLNEARERAHKYRQLVADGIDPIEHRKAVRNAAQVTQTKGMTFEECAAAYVEGHGKSWSYDHHKRWMSTMRKYVFPVVGHLDVAEIELKHVTKVLDPLFVKMPVDARRITNRIEAILAWATVREHRTGENVARWRGHLQLLYANKHVVEHHAALEFKDVPTFMQKLRAVEGANARSIEMIVLTATRKNETLGAKWSEFDFDDKVWVIPGSRTKSRKEHRIPLAPEVIKLLNGMPRTSDFVFSIDGRRPPSDASPTWLLNKMGYGQTATIHGFRSSFRDWAGETSNSPREVVEMALGHKLKDKAEAAYARGDLFTKRRKLMDGWASFCGKAPAKILGMPSAREARR